MATTESKISWTGHVAHLADSRWMSCMAEWYLWGKKAINSATSGRRRIRGENGGLWLKINRPGQNDAEKQCSMCGCISSKWTASIPRARAIWWSGSTHWVRSCLECSAPNVNTLLRCPILLRTTYYKSVTYLNYYPLVKWTVIYSAQP